MIYEVGDKVRVNLNANEQIQSIQEVWKYQGAVSTIVRSKMLAYGNRGMSRGTYYQLDGISSESGLPFSFLAEQLLPVTD